MSVRNISQFCCVPYFFQWICFGTATFSERYVPTFCFCEVLFDLRLELRDCIHGNSNCTDKPHVIIAVIVVSGQSTQPHTYTV